MSVSMTKADGVTVFTLTSDPQSAWPPLCQILKALCYSPVCCSVSQHLRRVQSASLSVLGALHIMVGLLNVALGVILCSSGRGSSWQMDETLFPYWMGTLFMVFGIMCILSEKFPSVCLVGINVILNLAGAAFAVAAIVLYSLNVADIWLWWMCHFDDYDYNYGHVKPSVSPALKEKCMEGKELTLLLLRGINGVLIVLSALELCVAISAAVLGIKALRNRKKGGNQNTGDPELHKPLLEEVA